MRQAQRLLSLLLGLCMVVTMLVPIQPAQAAEADPAAAQLLDTRRLEIAPDTYYNWYSMRVPRGFEKVHTVEFDPKNPSLELIAGTKGGKVYGMQGVTEMAKYYDKPGQRVIAGVNGDFYDLTGYGTGVPGGLFMGDGKILNTPDSNYGVFLMDYDGTTRYVPNPKLTRTVTIGGVTSDITHINRYRAANQLVLYTFDYADSTKTNEFGDEVVLDVLEGEVKHGQTLKLKVAEVRKDAGNTPLAAGKVVLSASGTARPILAGLKAGDEITASFAFPAGYENIKVAMSGYLLMKDGVVLNSVPPAGVHPRTAIGTKADGTVVMIEIDGRQPGFSEGVETSELGDIMKSMGVINAINLDGGGSSTFIARLPGEASFKLLNTPSDGGERQTGNSLLLVNKAPEGAAAKLVVQPRTERVLAGAKLDLETEAVDGTGHPAAMPGTPSWNVDPEYGTINDQGVFTAGAKAGTAEIQVSANGLTGTGSVEIVTELTELKFPDVERAVDTGASIPLKVQALRSGQQIVAENRLLQWRVEGDIGTVDTDGVFTATNESGKSGKIFVTYGSIETSMTVNVGTPPAMLEDFEGDLSKYLKTAGASYNKAVSSITYEDEYVRFGSKALKLEYDFIGKPSTSGVYLQSIAGADNYIKIPGYPKKIGMWVYGDGSGYWLRAQLRADKGSASGTPINFTDEVTGVNWKGWKYVEADVPAGLKPDLRLDMPVRLMATAAKVKKAGAIYVDNIRALYGPSTDDIEPPIIKNVEPAEGATIKTNVPNIRAIAEDAGYDRTQHPGTTLIDPAKIAMFIDNNPVTHTLYPPEGRIAHKVDVPLVDGLHKAKLQVRDLSGNRTEKEWTFNVDTGSAKFQYSAPSVTFAGGTYAVEIKGSNVSMILGGELKFQFDPTKVEALQFVPGGKLGGGQAQAVVDSAAGTAQVTFSGLSGLALTDADLLGSIRYRMKPDAEGKHTIQFQSGSIKLASSPDRTWPFFGLPLEADIQYGLDVSWDELGVVQGLPTPFTITDAAGAAASDAKLLVDGVERGTADAAGKLTLTDLTAALKTYKVQAVKDSVYSQVKTLTVSKLFGTTTPYNVNVSMGTDPKTERGFTWHTHPSVESTVVELAKLDGFTGFDQPDVKKVAGGSSLFVTYDIGTVRVHKALVSELEPGTTYVYRVGDGSGNVSGQGSFSTAPESGDHLKFLFFGDSQAADSAGFDKWGATLTKAVNEHPDADFLAHAGDMVDSGHLEAQWNLFFDKVKQQLMNTTFVSVLGNHEVTGTKGISDFAQHFNQPGNGLDTLRGTHFSFDYKDAHIVVLNSEYQYAEQKEWLRQDLAATKQKWKIVLFHRGPYGSIYDTVETRSSWTPVFDEFQVDLVLSGHDHIYLRNYMKGNQQAAAGEGTAYVVAGSTGPKFYDLVPKPWTQFYDGEQTQMYVAVETVGNEMTVVTKTVAGREVDRFTLSKKQAESVVLNKPEVQLPLGGSVQLEATVLPADAADRSVTWSVYSSTAPSVVEVTNDGLVKAIGVGSAVVRASSVIEGVYADSLVRVLDSAQAIRISGSSELTVGASEVTVTEIVYNGRWIPVTSGVMYASERTEVAEIQADGTVIAKSAGQTVISATYGELRDSYMLTVTNPVVELRLSVGDKHMKVGDSSQTVLTAVYADDSSRHITDGIVYTSSDNAIVSVNTDGLIKALRAGEATITAYYGGKSSAVTVKVTERSDDSSDSSDSPQTPVPSANPPQQPQTKLEEQLKAGGALELQGDKRQLELPGTVLELLQDKPSITVKSEQVAVEIPSSILSKLLELVPADQRKDSTISFGVAPVASRTVEQALHTAGQQNGATIETVGDVLDFHLEVKTKDGKTGKLTSFSEPITLTFNAQPTADRRLAGVYYISDSGELEYVGGKWVNGTLVASVTHFSQYAVLKYSKSFADVPAGHWAADEIQVLAAKHLVQGINEREYALTRNVTRAEFTALLVRILGLKQESGTTFKDVHAEDWFAQDVAKAVKAGIVNGVSADTFAPQADITRQEVAAMIVRAQQFAGAGDRASGGAVMVQTSFADMEDAPAWAQEAVGAAYSLGLIQGRSDTRYEPQAAMTRAESAQVLYNMLQLIERQTK
ncbi:phosphodiester glycosidase family protein [Paenibacillus chartarius]|uniref:Phosphodiester glycosidase family protein n=1 Tax=Paenibacillus chartarius TaxID=747481 RepID=A0ABV6DMY1_9BACL